ncbi:UDP-glucose 4-epimerase GalE [Kwoniella pini CBS 10737]|uniref:UDP-glucose 4-epimerase n=1 Tax=Kwoniella pini CBS 10737 TaxID=1296096 RepID=A0A1B9HU06_9TREE|nr:UDP-glucose 4-epimerase [Kwoniella pini CBS 10737]OCF46752.1 UDP-glucose 4-epimerase [Kwoniella pini CBS 10737]
MTQQPQPYLNGHSHSLKRVVVTGGLGYIGSHVVVSLLLTGQYQPIVIDNCHNCYPEALNRCAEIARDELGPDAPQPILHNVDLRNAEAVEDVFSQYDTKGGIWAVIHLAALKAVGESGEIPLSYYRVNVGGSISLFESMARHNVQNLVFSSSATVYGTPEVIPILETSPLLPASCYGRTKAMVEEIIQDLCKVQNKDGQGSLRAVSVRYFNPAGAHPSGKLGEEPRGKPGNLLPLLAQIAIGREKSQLKIFGTDFPTPDGTCVRDYLHILDLAHGHVLALDALAVPTSEKNIFSNCDAESGSFRSFNLGKGKGMSVLNMIDAMRKATGYDYQYEIVGRRRGDVPDLTADTTLAEKELGFVATRNLEEMCRDLWNFQTKHANGYGTA